MRVAVLTLGCRVNQAETAVIEGTLRDHGVNIVSLDENPEYCVINTCSVTARSDYNSRQLIRRAVRAGSRVLVTGCYAQLRPSEIAAISGELEIFPQENKFGIIGRITGSDVPISFGNQSRSRPHLKIQDGCNFSCSYCAVPLARGGSKSVVPDEVVRRAEMIDAAGYKEIVLTGIHLGTYGQELVPRVSLSDLIKRVLLATKNSRIRLSSIEIHEVNSELMDLFKDPRICRHLHIPMQSGSSDILKKMKRTYSGPEYAERLLKIAASVDNLCLGTDVIVGFPGEGKFEFGQTESLVSELPFSYLHVFPFSPRAGTLAEKMSGRAEPEAVRERMETMKELNRRKKLAYMDLQAGRILEVILEHSDEERMYGTSGNYQKISMSRSGYRKGSVVLARSVKTQEDHLDAVVIK